MPLISYNYASRNVSRMKGTLLFTVKIALSFMVVVALGYFFFAGPLTEMFMSNPDVVSYGAAFLRGFCLGLPSCAWTSSPWACSRPRAWGATR